MVVVQGFIAYFIYKAATGISLSFPGFLAGMGLISLFMISVLALTLMLGTLFNSRGPILAIIITGLMIILFIIVALVRFEREEF